MNIISAIQMNSTHCLEANLEQAYELMGEASKAKPKLVVLPEMFALMGTDTLGKIKIKETLGSGKIQTFLEKAAQEFGFWIVAGTIPIATDNPEKVSAASLVYNDKGQVVARYNKIHLFDVIVKEGHEEYKESDTTVPGQSICVIDTPVGRMGLAVCYDLRFPELFRVMFNEGAQWFAIPSAFTAVTGQAHWQTLTQARAIENLSYVVGACQGGTHSGGRKTYGHSLIINPWGQVIESLDLAPGVISAEINLTFLQECRHRIPVMAHQTLFVNKS